MFKMVNEFFSVKTLLPIIGAIGVGLLVRHQFSPNFSMMALMVSVLAAMLTSLIISLALKHLNL